MKITLHHFFDVFALKQIIEKQDFYNNCLDKENKIGKIITFANFNEPTPKNIYKIAKDFHENSISDDIFENDKHRIEITMKYIHDNCIVTYYSIYEKEVTK